MAPVLTASLWALAVLCSEFVSADQNITTVKAEPGEIVNLPCRDPDQGEVTVVEWSRTDLGSQYVLLYKNGRIDPFSQHQSYEDRADLLVNQMWKGDVSLILKNTATDDSGTYECRVAKTNREKKLISTVILDVAPPPPPPPPEPFPVWARVLLVLLVLLVLALIAAGVAYYFRDYFISVSNKEVESGAESVLLRCRTLVRLPGDARVEWRDTRGRKVHVYQNGSDQPGEQNQLYRTRTSMNEDLLKTGDLSLTLRRPTYGDRGVFTCRVSSRDGDVLMKKQVLLEVKVPQVEVDSGAESVLLSCRATVQLPGDARVEWRDRDDRTVHVYQNGSDQPGEQDQRYRTRTRMNEDLLETGDLSLTLEWPTDGDRGVFTCSVSSRDGDVLMEKQVLLEVKAHQVEVKKGAESVLLPFTTTPGLPKDAEVRWWDEEDRTVHVYKNGSDQPGEQDQSYRTRTRMNEDLLETGDLSLTLRRPTERDSGRFFSVVTNDSNTLAKASVLLRVEGRTAPVQPEDVRTRNGATDPTPLMADEAV
ncbi:butyrophilin-like protein 2 [Anableps anableps]